MNRQPGSITESNCYLSGCWKSHNLESSSSSSSLRLIRVTVVWRRELGVLVNWTDVLDGEIVNAAWAVAGMVVKPRTGRRTVADLDTAAWADTERLIKDVLAGISASPGLPDLPEDEAAELEAALRQHEVQGALQALLAARLTDAPEADAARARGVLAARLAAHEAVRLALSGPEGRVVRGPRRSARVEEWGTTVPKAADSPYAEKLSEYFDDKISALVATLEGRVGYAGLAQVRAEAYNARIVALLGAIERQVAALADRGRGGAVEAEWLTRYRRQVRQWYGRIEPPDFERRRLVPIASIYVPTGIEEHVYPERRQVAPAADAPSRSVLDLSGMLGRTVLLGDPGGGKTTAAKFLAHEFASDPDERVPFLVTLREYAAKSPLEWSVAGFIEHQLETVHQCPAADGLVERLLLTGRAVVIFDGLDELLDTSRRREVSRRVEQFCTAFPLTPVLVTSRVVGYDEARLDEEQFSCYQLGRFSDEQVAEYAGRWFASQDELPPAEAAQKAQSFLEESAKAKDLRANPLLLSLMCILYRGSGSLPGDRPGVYARCAELLLRKWDEQRDLYRELRADYLIEPVLRHLAWWLLTHVGSSAAATERELIDETTKFLHGRGFEDGARSAALEFVTFSRGRMWVFSDAGTTADGEVRYGFTHLTFLEYFAAWHLAVTSDSPEELARSLGSLLPSGVSNALFELAIQIKDRNSDRGTDRIFTVLLDLAATDDLDLGDTLATLATILESTKPSRPIMRRLTNAALDCYFDYGMTSSSRIPLIVLLETAGSHGRMTVADTISTYFSAMVSSVDAGIRTAAMLFALEVSNLRLGEFWQEWSAGRIHDHTGEIVARAAYNNKLRRIALTSGILTIDEALSMPGGMDALMVTDDEGLIEWMAPYPLLACQAILEGHE